MLGSAGLCGRCYNSWSTNSYAVTPWQKVPTKQYWPRYAVLCVPSGTTLCCQAEAALLQQLERRQPYTYASQQLHTYTQNRILTCWCAVSCCAVVCLQAQALLQQLERRQLYKYVSEVTLDVNAQQRYTAGGKPTADEIVSYQSSAQTGVSAWHPQDLILYANVMMWPVPSALLVWLSGHQRLLLVVLEGFGLWSLPGLQQQA